VQLPVQLLLLVVLLLDIAYNQEYNKILDLYTFLRYWLSR
jgi:hypothetical protein